MGFHDAGACVEWTRIILAGDSLTQWGGRQSNSGWVSGMYEAYETKAEIINRGASGYNTRSYLALLPHLAPALRPRNPRSPPKTLLILSLGSNDVCKEPTQHVPLAEYKENLAALIRAWRSILSGGLTDLVDIIVIGPPSMDEAAWAASRELSESNRTNADLEQYRGAAAEVANATGAGFVSMAGISHPDCFVDGLHLSPKGNVMWAETLVKFISSAFPHWSPEALPRLWPDWADLEPSNPGKTIEGFFKTGGSSSQ